jgi:hypothetical protein
MFKVVFFLWRNPDLTRDEYLRYYEDTHAVLISSLLPRGVDYRRSYPVWNIPPGRTSAAPSGNTVFNLAPFDSMTELWYDERSDCEQMMALAGESPVRDLLEADETKFINRACYIYCALDERGREQTEAAIPQKAATKIIRFARRAPTISSAEFKERYEHNLVPLKQASIPGLVTYRRNYPMFNDALSFIGIYTGPTQPYFENKYAVDLIEEIWCSEVHNAQRAFDILDADQSLVDHNAAFTAIVTEHRSPYGRVMAPVAAG